MNFQHLIYLLEVNKRKSFSQAANSLFVSQPTISKAISALEEEFDITIFLRDHRNVKLTPDGESFVKMAEGMVGQYEAMKDFFETSENTIEFVFSSTHSTFVSMSFYRLLERHKDTDNLLLTMINASTLDVLNSVQMGQSELGIILLSAPYSSFTLKEIEKKNLLYTCLANSTISVILGRNNPLSEREQVQPNELLGHTYVTTSSAPIWQSSDTPKFIDDFYLLDHLSFTRKVVVADRIIAYKIIDSSNAFTFAFGQDRDYVDGFDLRCVPLAAPRLKQEFGCVKLKKRTLSPIAEEFVELLKYEFAHKNCHGLGKL